MTKPSSRASDSDAAVEDLAHLLARVSGLRRAVSWDAAAFELPDLHRAAHLVQRHQPADPPGEPASQEAIDALVGWAQTRGVRIAKGLRFTATPRGTEVVVSAPIAAGAPLVEVPVDAMVRTSEVVASHPTIGPWLEGTPLFGPGTLMLWLMVACYGDDPSGDPWSTYVAALPGAVPGTALSWPRSPGSHLVAADMGGRFLAGVLQLYCLVYRRLLLTPAAQRPLPLDAFTLQRWLWTGAILSSRQTEIAGELALVPVWDLLAHDESPQAAMTALEGDELRCTASVELGPGDMAAMYYGNRTPTERWVYAGFVPPGPPDGARAMLPFPLPATAPLRRNKLVWLVSERDRPVEVAVGRGDLDDALERARWYALDADELERLGFSSVVDAWGQPLQLSEAGEARARELLDAWLGERAGPPTPEEPFSREHAFVLAAAHARYAGMLQPAEGPRLLDDSDALAVEAFLASEPGAPLLLRTNLHAAGLVFSGIRHSGTWVGVFEGAELVGVAIHARNGYLTVHAKHHAPVLARHVLDCSGRSLVGLAGACAQVDAIRDALELREHEPASDARYRVCSLELESLHEANPPPGEALRVNQVEGGRWQVELAGEVVSTATLNPRVGGVVEITNVSTAEDMRGRGYASLCLTTALADARGSGAVRALLLVEADNLAARGVYEALGFLDLGDYAIVSFET